MHAHPDAAFALGHLSTGHGKANALYILTAGGVFLGLREVVSLSQLQTLVDEQDIEAMLQLMHRISVEPNQWVDVPPGVLQTIGEGVFLIEVQEPEDLSILLEWRNLELNETDGHLRLGFRTALSAMKTCARTDTEVAGLLGRGPGDSDVFAADAPELVRMSASAAPARLTSTAGSPC